jgi:hypothetical protein
LRKFIALFFVFTCCLVASPAQQKKSVASNKWEVFGGYSYSRAYIGGIPFSPFSLNGGQASGSYFFNKYLGATAEFAAYTDEVTPMTIHTQGYLFGPTGRLNVTPRISLYAHQLFGVTHFSLSVDGADCAKTSASCTTNPFTMVSGGGVDIRLNKHFSIRPAQMEYFSQQISLADLVGGELAARPPSGIHANATPGSGTPKISGDGFRYTGGAVFRF